MIRLKQQKTHSIKTKIILGLLALLIPLVSLLLIYNFYTVKLLREKTALSNKNTLAIYSEIVESNLQATRSQLLDTFTADNNFYKIRNSENPLNQYLAIYNVSKRYQSLLAGGSTADLFFVYSPRHRLVNFNDAFNSSLSFDQRLAIRTELEAFSADEEQYVRYNWTPVQIGEDYFLVNVLGNDGVYLGAAIRLKDMVFPLAKGKLFDDYQMLYVSPEGQPLTELSYAAEKDLDLRPSESIYTLSGFPDRFMVLSESLDAAPVRMVAALPDPTFLTTFNAVQLFLFVASLLTVLIIPLALWMIRGSLLQPVGKLVRTMEKIRSGNLDARADEKYASTEFRQVNDTFNLMIDEIQHLKIDGYEKQLARQKAELQYLQFQIRPHFYLNSLKSLYGMAQNGKTREIQQLILALSNHFRYMFKDNFTLVRLRDELGHVKNYIQIQQLYTSRDYHCEIDVEEQLMDLMIPPISIQTFVENALKHASQPDKTLEIRIRARMLVTEEEQFANITILDNGPGFDDDKLEELNFADPVTLGGGHVGLANVLQRLLIIYAGKAHVAFTNDPTTGGALCELLVPISRSTSRPALVQEYPEGNES